MTATVVLAFAVIGMVAVVGTAIAMTWWLVKKLLGKSDAERDATVDAGVLTAEGKLKDYAIATWKREAERSDQLADHLAEELRDALANPVLPSGPVLRPGDVDSRILRFYEAEVGARGRRPTLALPAGDEVHPAGVEAVAGGLPAAEGGEARAAESGDP